MPPRPRLRSQCRLQHISEVDDPGDPRVSISIICHKHVVVVRVIVDDRGSQTVSVRRETSLKLPNEMLDDLAARGILDMLSVVFDPQRALQVPL